MHIIYTHTHTHIYGVVRGQFSENMQIRSWPILFFPSVVKNCFLALELNRVFFFFFQKIPGLRQAVLGVQIPFRRIIY